jgi:hypothetical protein
MRLGDETTSWISVCSVPGRRLREKSGAARGKGEMAMNRRIPLLVAVIALLIAVGPVVAYAQEQVVANVPFRFISAGRTHDPGEYQLRVSEDQMNWTLTPVKGTPTAAMVVTRLAAHDSPTSSDRLVFDRVGDTYYLSEVWPSGGDGYLLHATKEKHTHHVIKLLRRAK